MIFAHGPWFTEWHHLLIGVPMIVGVWAWYKVKRASKGSDKEEEQ